jgi:hypothetical protein
MSAAVLTILAAAVLLAVPVVILITGGRVERRRCRRFDEAYEANLRSRRPDEKR